jgi:hypothetical protein
MTFNLLQYTAIIMTNLSVPQGFGCVFVFLPKMPDVGIIFIASLHLLHKYETTVA